MGIIPARIKMVRIKYFLFFLLLMTGTINHEFNVFSINISYLDFVVLATLLILFFYILQNHRVLPKIFFNIFLILFLYYIFIIAYSLYIGANIHEIGGRLRNFYVYPLMFFTGYIFTNTEKDKVIYFALVKIYIIIAVGLGIAKLFFPLENLLAYPGIDRDDYYMMVQHGTGLIAFMGLVHQYIQISMQKKVSGKNFIFMIICITAIIGTQNRSVIISAAVVSIMLIIYQYVIYSGIKIKKGRIALLAMILVCIIIIIQSNWFTGSKVYQEYFSERVDRITVPLIANDGYFNVAIVTRLARVGGGLIEWSKSPIIGRGFKGIEEMEYIDLISGKYRYTLHKATALSYPVELLLRTGIIGFLIVMTFWYSVFKGLRQSPLQKNIDIEVFTIRMFLIACMIYSCFNYNLSGDSPFIAAVFYISGIGVACNRKNN